MKEIESTTAVVPADQQTEIDGQKDTAEDELEFDISVRKIDFPVKPRGVLAE